MINSTGKEVISPRKMFFIISIFSVVIIIWGVVNINYFSPLPLMCVTILSIPSFIRCLMNTPIKKKPSHHFKRDFILLYPIFGTGLFILFWYFWITDLGSHPFYGYLGFFGAVYLIILAIGSIHYKKIF